MKAWQDMTVWHYQAAICENWPLSIGGFYRVVIQISGNAIQQILTYGDGAFNRFLKRISKQNIKAPHYRCTVSKIHMRPMYFPVTRYAFPCQGVFMEGPRATHYNDILLGAMASQITSLTFVYSTFYSGADQRKHQSSAPLAFVRGIHRWPVNYPHKWPVTRKMFPFDDVIMKRVWLIEQ